MFTTCHTPFFKFALVCFLLFSSFPLHFSVDAPPHLDSYPPDPLTGDTPPIGRLSQCVHPLSLTTTFQARRATWRTLSRALHALHLLIRGTARTGTPLPLPSMPLYTQTRPGAPPFPFFSSPKTWFVRYRFEPALSFPFFTEMTLWGKCYCWMHSFAHIFVPTIHRASQSDSSDPFITDQIKHNKMRMRYIISRTRHKLST